jgi:hypothetical protein
VPDGPIVSKFEIDKMMHQDEFYNTVEDKGGSTVIVHWKTNLKSKSDKVNFYLYNETTNELANGDSSIAKKKYNSNNANATTVKTNDGYAFTITEKKPGTYKYSVAIFGPDNDYNVEKTKYTLPFTITFKDYETAENQEYNNLIKRSGADSESTVKDKLNTLARYMAKEGWKKGSFIHPGKAEPGEYVNTYGDHGVWFQSRVITCVEATSIIKECAAKMGVQSDFDYPTGPGFGAFHVRNKFTINGDTFTVDGSPLTFIKPWTNI